jgi:hypothetical protein
MVGGDGVGTGAAYTLSVSPHHGERLPSLKVLGSWRMQQKESKFNGHAEARVEVLPPLRISLCP